jgi:hypothetical protein
MFPIYVSNISDDTNHSLQFDTHTDIMEIHARDSGNYHTLPKFRKMLTTQIAAEVWLVAIPHFVSPKSLPADSSTSELTAGAWAKPSSPGHATASAGARAHVKVNLAAAPAEQAAGRALEVEISLELKACPDR